MALELSERAKLLSSGNNIQAQLILEIDGIDEIFGAVPVLKSVRFDDDDLFFDDPNFFLDTGLEDPNSRPWISLDETTKALTQQIQVDKGGTSSVSSMDVHLVDIKAQVSEIFKPGNNVSDILGTGARLYMNFSNGGVHPEDSVLVQRGIISNASAKIGSWVVTIDHPGQLKRQEVFFNITTNLDGAINDSVTTITLNSVGGLLEPADTITTYVRIDDELIQYTGISGNDLTGCTRGVKGTTASSHDDDAEVSSRIGMADTMINCALKLMISGSGVYRTGVAASSFNIIDDDTTVQNAVFFIGVDLQEDYGLVVGDLMTITGSVSNDFTDATILSFGSNNSGTYAVVDTALTDETDATASGSFKSQYDVWPDGLSMSPELVDVAQHLFWDDVFSSSFLDYDFLLDETIEGDRFLADEIYWPQGAIEVPRKGRASMNLTTPGLALTDIKTLDITNIKDPAGIGLNRSINKFLYSSVTYKYQPDFLDTNTFTAGLITLDQDSKDRIKVGNRNLTIESRGLRRTASTDQLLTSMSERLLERYRFASSFLVIRPFFSASLTLEVGDAVLLDGTDLQLTDLENGTRGAPTTFYEVINTDRDITTGDTSVTLLNVNQGLDGRFGVFSPSSFIAASSTTTRIRLKKSFSTTESELEINKWTDFVGLRILVHDDNWTFQEEVEIVGFDEGQDAIICEPLSVAPSEDYIVDIADYPDTTDARDQDKYKVQFWYFTPEIGVTGGTSTTVFTVDEPGELKADDIVEVSKPDYSLTGESTILSVVGSTVTLNTALPFTPASGDIVNLINFKDGGKPYRIF